ncbi:MAG: hypothetical protein AKCLJLPJ_01695 [Fimbriimonadales bacterium]|nr:hypothetical protein [Fimbriimonadales bacterium]
MPNPKHSDPKDPVSRRDFLAQAGRKTIDFGRRGGVLGFLFALPARLKATRDGEGAPAVRPEPNSVARGQGSDE